MPARRFPRLPRLRWKLIYLLTSAGLLLAVLTVGAAATCRPSWYTPTAIDQSRLQADKREFVNLVDEIGRALNAGQIVNIELREEQVNRWIAARAEFGSVLGYEIEVEGISYVQIVFLDGNRIRLGATATNLGLDVVLSATLRLELTSDGLLGHLESVRTGVLPVPSAPVLDPIREMLESDDAAVGSVSGKTIRLPKEGVWPNGRRHFRVRRLEISQGVARVSLEPVTGGP